MAGLKSGDTVLALLSGGGYFTHPISKAVGPKGHVYAVAPEGKFREAAAAIAADPAYANAASWASTRRSWRRYRHLI